MFYKNFDKYSAMTQYIFLKSIGDPCSVCFSKEVTKYTNYY